MNKPVLIIMIMLVALFLPVMAGYADQCSVQVFASPDRSQAERIMSDENLRDLNLYITEARVKGRTYYRVRLGHFKTAGEAYHALAKARGKLYFRLPYRDLLNAFVARSCPGINSVEARRRRQVNRLIRSWFGLGQDDAVLRELKGMDKAALRRVRELLLADSYVAGCEHQGAAVEFRKYHHLMTYIQDLLGELVYDHVLQGEIVKCPGWGSGFWECEFRPDDGRKLRIMLSCMVAGNWHRKLSPVGRARVYLKKTSGTKRVNPVKVEFPEE